MESWSQSHRKTSLWRTEIAEPLYSGHHFAEPIAVLYSNLPLYSGQLLFIKIYYKVAMFCTNENIERKDLNDNQGQIEL